MREIEYGNQVLEFPDDMDDDAIADAIRELPEEKALGEKLVAPNERKVMVPEVLPLSERYKAGVALERLNPTVAKEARKIALERKHGYIAASPFSVERMVANIPQNVEEIVGAFSAIIAQTGLFTYRFGRNIVKDLNTLQAKKFATGQFAIDDKVDSQLAAQFKPAADLGRAIYVDWKAMFAGEVSDEISKLPMGQIRDAIWDKIERQGIGDTLKYFIQDNPVDALLFGTVLKTMAGTGVKYSLKSAQLAVPKGSKMARTLDSVLGTKRAPIIYSLGPEKEFAKLSAKVQKDTAGKLLKASGDIGGMTLDDLASLSGKDPVAAIKHIRKAKVSYDVVMEGLRNKGAKVVMGAQKTERGVVSQNLDRVINTVDKISKRQPRKVTVVSKQVRATRTTGGSSFSPGKGDLVGSDNFAISLFPDYSKIVKGKITNKQLNKFYLDNADILKQYPELAVGTWFDNGQTYIDLVVTVPTKNKYAAMGLGNRYNQKAMFNLKTLEEVRLGGTGKSIAKLPSIEARMAEVRRVSPPAMVPKTGTAELKHWTTRQGLREIDPAKHGTGLKGAESERKIADPDNWVDRSYFGIEGGGYVPEVGLGTITYRVKVPYKDIYDFNNDPLKLRAAISKEKGDPVSLYESAIKAKGFQGYYVDSPTAGNIVAMFNKVTPETPPLPGSKIVPFERTYSADPLTKYIFEKTFDAALERFPGMKKAFVEHKAKKLIGTMRNASEEANFTERAKMHEEVYKKLDTLSKEEQAIIVPYLEGRAQLISEPSEQFKNYELWYRNLIAEHETHLHRLGKIPEDDERLYQPIAKATGQTVEQVKADMGTFTPVYVHHTFPDMHAPKMGIHFAETTGKRFRPGFFKKSKGVGGYSEDLREILPKYTSEYIKFKHTEKFITDFTKKFGIKVNLKDIKTTKGGLTVGDKEYLGYRIVAPDGYLSFFRGKIDLQKEILKHMENATFNEAVGEVISGINLPTKQYMGVSKNKIVYLVPEKMVGELESFATPVFGSQKAQDVIRLVVDKPTQIWKDSVLAISPRWIKNNVMGDIIFNTFEGVGPLSYSRAFRTVYKDCIPDELLKASFANVMKYNPKLGNTAKTAVGHYVQEMFDSKISKGIAVVKDTGYALNTMVEQPFVRALYVNIARKEAVTLLKAEGLKRTEVNILNKMRIIKNSEELSRPLITKVHETLPVFNLLGNFERKYIRRFVPFANWYKFMLKYAAQLPAKHPFKTIGARGLGALSEDGRERIFKDYFPYMTREIEDAGIPSRFNHLWPIGEKGEKMAKFFNVRGMNPFTTIEDFVELDFINMASPIITVPVEQVTGRAVFGNRKYESGEAGITVTHKGVEYEEFEKIRPPLVDHIMSQMPQYTMLKKWLVPARQWDTGTLLNPDPMLNPDTGEYVYPIESVEKILNMLGVDQRTMNVRDVWYKYQNRKAQALGRALTKHRENLSFQDIRDILKEIRGDEKLWKQISNEINEKAQYKEERTRELLDKVK